MSHLCDSTLTFTDLLKWDQPVLANEDSITDLIKKFRSRIEHYADPKATLKKVIHILILLSVHNVVDVHQVLKYLNLSNIFYKHTIFLVHHAFLLFPTMSLPVYISNVH